MRSQARAKYLIESERMAEGIGAEPDQRAIETLSDEELVDAFLSHLDSDWRAAHNCFEAIIARHHWLINHIVRSTHFRFPAWDSQEDVISRVVFKVYRGLGLWRREGKLSSFIARIATSELIDTYRRVGRDKSWTPRPLADPDSDLPSPVDNAPSRELSPEAAALKSQQTQLIEQLLDDVCRDWKDSVVVNEYIIGEKNAKELSEKYEMSEDLIYQRARRLKVRLMNWLRERGITSAEALLAGGAGRK
jgi:RNA polymerase sigma-70 factor (ECF subfamily)